MLLSYFKFNLLHKKLDKSFQILNKLFINLKMKKLNEYPKILYICVFHIVSQNFNIFVEKTKLDFPLFTFQF